ncbi:MAG TPA: thioesterase family protein [Rhizomicrobium sp.]|jgi:acyl-CoA thioesterase II|nr:thioesterase family protein [Rhizomicrobium sp.]
MGKLQDDTALVERDGKLFATLSRDWEIWGPNGGYVAAIALRAAGKAAPAGHRPATISVQYLSAGQFAEAEAVVEAVKKGRSAWCINVALVQNGKRFLQAQVWTTDRSEGPNSNEHEMPDVPGPAGLKSYAEIYPRESEKRNFWDNFEGRPTRIYTREDPSPDATIREWHRYPGFDAGGDVFADFARPLILIDTLQWPAHNRPLPSYPSYIAPSLDVSVWFHQAPGTAVWLLADVHTATAVGGLIHGAARVWSEDGRLLASGSSHMIVTPRG